MVDIPPVSCHNFASLTIATEAILDKVGSRNIVLICPHNDAESIMIVRLADHMNMCVVVSNQPPGASLDKEPDLLERLADDRKTPIWIVEIPGLRMEAELAALGHAVTIIDHHVYGAGEDRLDRTRRADGTRLPSSLEQFIALAGISDSEMLKWELSPRIVRGLGVFDDRYVKGLRDDGYDQDEIRQVIDLRNDCLLSAVPQFRDLVALARRTWTGRKKVGDYLVVVSRDPKSLRGEIGMCSVASGLDTHPLVISDMDGAELFVQNVGPEVIETLQSALALGPSTFLFGANRCFGVNNGKRPPDDRVTLDILLGILAT